MHRRVPPRLAINHFSESVCMPHTYKIFIFIFVLLLPAQSALAANIAIITRKNILPYDAFVEGYQEAYIKHSLKKHDLKVFFADPVNTSQDAALGAQVSSFRPDLIIAVGTNSVKIAELCCLNVPLIYSMVIDNRRTADMKKPNQCGISMEPDMHQRLQVLLEFNKSAKRIGAVYNPSESNDQLRELQQAARQKNLMLDAIPVASAKDALPAIEAVVGRVDAFMLLFDKSLFVPQVVEFLFSCSFRSRVPVIGLSEKYTSLGSLFSVQYDVRDLGAEAWDHTAAFLSGDGVCTGLQKPTAAPRLFINKKIADKMGILIPAKLSEQCTFVE
jgi:putative ABC transport system substrate-binding protein